VLLIDADLRRPAVARQLAIEDGGGGLAEVVGRTGLQFPAGNAEALAECMRRVMRDASIIDSIGLKARERARQLFARGRMIDEHAHVYHEAFRRRMGRASNV